MVQEQNEDIQMIQPVSNSTQIIQVIHAAFNRYALDPMPSSALAETSATIEQDISNGILIFGTFQQDILIGVVKVTTVDNSLYFSRLAVVPEQQGRGIASALVSHIEQFGMSQNITRVTCKVRKSEASNIALYTKLGYRIIKEELSTSPLGFVMATVLMEKQLTCT